jgi:hypothetical protein
MVIPPALRKQVNLYAAYGFTLVEAEPRAGSHFKVRFAEFDEPQFISASATDPRGWKNNIARYRRLRKEKEFEQHHASVVQSAVHV